MYYTAGMQKSVNKPSQGGGARLLAEHPLYLPVLVHLLQHTVWCCRRPISWYMVAVPGTWHIRNGRIRSVSPYYRYRYLLVVRSIYLQVTSHVGRRDLYQVPVPGYQYSGRNDSESNASMDGLPSKFHSITSHTASLALFTNAGDGLYEWLVRKYR